MVREVTLVCALLSQLLVQSSGVDGARNTSRLVELDHTRQHCTVYRRWQQWQGS